MLNNSRGCTPRTAASFPRTSTVGFAWPRSMRPRCRIAKSASPARSSWDRPRAFRSCLILYDATAYLVVAGVYRLSARPPRGRLSTRPLAPAHDKSPGAHPASLAFGKEQLRLCHDGTRQVPHQERRLITWSYEETPASADRDSWAALSRRSHTNTSYAIANRCHVSRFALASPNPLGPSASRLGAPCFRARAIQGALDH